MNKSMKFVPDVRERALRVVQQRRGEYQTLWALLEPIDSKFCCVSQTLLGGVQRHAVESGMRA